MESRGFGQRVRRSSYRPDRWGVFENAILLSSLLITGAIWFAPFDGALSYFIIGLFAALLALFRKERA
jgi:hypothetical protein